MAVPTSQGSAVIGQAGGPTAVINQSLAGLVEGLQGGLYAAGRIDRILGMRHGVRGLLGDDLVDLTSLGPDRLERVAVTPSAALGSTRDKPDADYCARILDSCRRLAARYFFYIGGNDSADTCNIVAQQAEAAGYELRSFHVPKTIDNDLRENDHTPGFASAARFVVTAFMGDSLDNSSLPGIKINVVMGRQAGFLTAASALARGGEDAATATRGPHLVYVPEQPFDTDGFLQSVEEIYRRLGRCQVAVSEGICRRPDLKGKERGEVALELAIRQGIPIEYDSHGNPQLSGSGALGDVLAREVRDRLTPRGGKPVRVRADTFGYIQRCWPDPSPVDSAEARRSGRHAAAIALSGRASGSIVIRRREEAGPYEAVYDCVDLDRVARVTRAVPEEFLSGPNDVSRRFVDWCRPLLGDLHPIEQL